MNLFLITDLSPGYEMHLSVFGMFGYSLIFVAVALMSLDLVVFH